MKARSFLRALISYPLLKEKYLIKIQLFEAENTAAIRDTKNESYLLSSSLSTSIKFKE